MTNKQEIIQHLRAIADLLEHEAGSTPRPLQDLLLESENSPKKDTRKYNRELAASFNVAKRYNTSCDIVRIAAANVGIDPVIDIDGAHKRREYYRYEDMPKLDKELRRLTKYNGKPYRIRNPKK